MTGYNYKLSLYKIMKKQNRTKTPITDKSQSQCSSKPASGLWAIVLKPLKFIIHLCHFNACGIFIPSLNFEDEY
jgi:hypothetical protein